MAVTTEKCDVQRIKRGGVVFYRIPSFSADKAVLHAFSTRIGGVSRGRRATLDLGSDPKGSVLCSRENRDLFARAVGVTPDRLVRAEQVHGDTVLEVGPSDGGRCPEPGDSLGKADALVTREVGIALMVLVADCLPVLIHDPVNRAVGVAHAGWRGTVSHVGVKALLEMGSRYGTQASDVRVAFGPCIGPCCYEVGDDVLREFADVFPWYQDVFQAGFGGNWMLDLAEANARQLREVGVKEKNLKRPGLCTIGNIGDFYSHRAEATPGEPTGRIAAVIMLR